VILTIIRHGKNGNLSDGSTPPFYTSGTFIDGGQICVHVSRETTSTWYFLSGSWNLQENQHCVSYTILNKIAQTN